MKVLVTNDDGVGSRGLHVLARALVDAGHDVVVAAPDREMSGSAAAIGHIHVDEAIDADPVELPGLAGVPSYAVAGPPGLCVLAARLGGFGDLPELVVAGINPGCNTGRAVLHSGTVGAALTAANFGVSGMAVSLDVSSRLLHEGSGGSGGTVLPTREGEEVVAEVVASPDGTEPADEADHPDHLDQPARWESAAAAATWFLGWIADAPRCTVLNVNVPNLSVEALAGVRVGVLAPFGTVRTGVVESAPEARRLQLELRPTTDEMPPESDSALVREGFVAITPLRGIGVDDGVDVSEALAVRPAGGWGTG